MWTIQNFGGNFYGLHTRGFYADSGTGGSGYGFLDFSFQNVQGGNSNFSASGNVPEPMTFSLVGLGLVGLGLYTRRRRKA